MSKYEIGDRVTTSMGNTGTVREIISSGHYETMYRVAIDGASHNPAPLYKEGQLLPYVGASVPAQGRETWTTPWGEEIRPLPLVHGSSKGKDRDQKQDYLPPPRTCNHWRDPFTFQSGDRRLTVYLTAYQDKGRGQPNGPQPQIGVYLDPAWTREQPLMSNGYIPRRSRRGQPEVLAVRWPDMGVVPSGLLWEVCNWMLARMHQKQAVELACLGGHGRTGTMLAALLVHCGHKPKDAIKLVRQGHCAKAIEAQGQEKLVEKYKDFLADLG